MRGIGILVALLVAPAAAVAAPFLACDVEPVVTHTQLQVCTTINTATSPATCTTWGAWSADTPVVTVASAKECRHDIATSAVGVNLVRAKAVVVDGTWGRQESVPSAPFVYSRPASPASPAGSRIVP